MCVDCVAVLLDFPNDSCNCWYKTKLISGKSNDYYNETNQTNDHNQFPVVMIIW